MTFDWSHLRLFLAVADQGSLSAAARALGVSQPTAGRQLQALESDLGVKLFARYGRRLSLTEAGWSLVEPARAMADAADRFALAAAGREVGLAGVVRITASEVVATYTLPPILVQLRRAEPEIEVELVASNATDNLMAREADIAVRMYRPTQPDVIARHIRQVPVGAFAAHSYLQRRGVPETADDLLKHDIVGYDRDDTLVRGFAAFGVDVSRRFFPFRTDDQVVAWRAVVAGYGIGFAQMTMGEAEPAVRRVVAELPLPTLSMWLTAHEELRGNRRIRRVFDFLAEGLAAAP